MSHECMKQINDYLYRLIIKDKRQFKQKSLSCQEQ